MVEQKSNKNSYRSTKEYKSLLAGMGMAQKPTNFIGLDIGSTYFRAVRIKKTGSGFSVQDTLVDKIEELGNLSSKMAVKDEEELCVNFNLEGIVIKRVSIPVMPQEEIESALKWELKEQHVGFDIDKARVRFSLFTTLARLSRGVSLYYQPLFKVFTCRYFSKKKTPLLILKRQKRF